MAALKIRLLIIIMNWYLNVWQYNEEPHKNRIGKKEETKKSRKISKNDRRAWKQQQNNIYIYKYELNRFRRRNPTAKKCYI